MITSCISKETDAFTKLADVLYLVVVIFKKNQFIFCFLNAELKNLIPFIHVISIDRSAMIVFFYISKYMESFFHLEL